ncbi:MAG: hypothetical protein LBU06_00535 [Desulfovibrio sp.]|jgi:hypothetical protein|nr:hypothetical protein [Desulfovibrio sp.]
MPDECALRVFEEWFCPLLIERAKLGKSEHFPIENIFSDEMLWRCEAKRSNTREIAARRTCLAVKRQSQA